MEHKSLYLVEELPAKRLCTSLLKQISANDPTSGRSLFKTSRQIELTGKLIINTNNCPNIPGEDGAAWDRMVLIPWDARYVGDGERVNRVKWQMPSDSVKIERLTELKSAFVTVCLNEIHDFYARSLVDGIPAVTSFPIPECVSALTKKKRELAFPLVIFVKKYLVATVVEQEFANINQVFYSFKHYMAKKRQPNRQNVTEFTEMLTKVSLEPFFCEDQMESFLKNYKLSPDGCLYADAEQAKDMMDGGDRFFVPYKPAPEAFHHQQPVVAPFAQEAPSVPFEDEVKEALPMPDELFVADAKKCRRCALPVLLGLTHCKKHTYLNRLSSRINKSTDIDDKTMYFNRRLLFHSMGSDTGTRFATDEQLAVCSEDTGVSFSRLKRCRSPVLSPVPLVPGFPLAHPVPDALYPLFALAPEEPPAKKARVDMSVRFNCDDY